MRQLLRRGLSLISSLKQFNREMELVLSDLVAESGAKDIAKGWVLITGAARRIGRGLALALASDGWNIHLHFHHSKDEAETTGQQITALGRMVCLHQADLSDEAACQQLMASCVEQGNLAALINSASSFDYDTSQAFSAQGMKQHMAINMMAPAMLIRDFAAAAENQSVKGAVINITDAKLVGLNPDYFTYTLSKMALDGLTRLAAQAYAPWLRVNGIAPGITLRSGDQTDAEYRQAHRLNPLSCGAEVEDIVRAAKMLLDTPSITGHTIVIDGGLHLRPPNRDVAFLDVQE